MAPRVIITKFPFENSNDESKDEIQTNSNDESKDENQKNSNDNSKDGNQKNSNGESKDENPKNSNDDSKDRIQTKRKYLCLFFGWYCQIRAKLRNLDQLRLKIQGHPKNPSPMSRPHQPQPFFARDEMHGMDSMHWNAFHGM